MTETPIHTDRDVPARARRDPNLPARDDHAIVAPAHERLPRDYVDDVSEASFPASDPPSWWGGH